MFRTTPRVVFVLSTLVIGLAIGVPGSVSAQTARTAVEGRADNPQLVDYQLRVDGAGGLHFRHFELEWDFSLHGGAIDIHGTQAAVLNGNLDENGTGPLSGTFVVRTPDQEVIWEGHMHALLVEWIVTGAVTAHGKGPFAGMLLQLVLEEDCAFPGDNPDTFGLTGLIVDPAGR